MYYSALTSTPPLHCSLVTVMTVNGAFWSPSNNLQHVVKSQTTRQMSNRFIYIQNCLQQGFWINIDPWGDICIQVHDTSCIIVSSQQREKKTLLQHLDPENGCTWSSLKNCKAQDTASTASLRPSSNTQQSTTYSAKPVIWFKLPTSDATRIIRENSHCLCKANMTGRKTSHKVSQGFDSNEARSNYKLNDLHFNLAWLYKAEINIKSKLLAQKVAMHSGSDAVLKSISKIAAQFLYNDEILSLRRKGEQINHSRYDTIKLTSMIQYIYKNGITSQYQISIQTYTILF